LNPAWATPCSSKSAVKVINILAHGIALNEELKQSANTDDNTRYKTIEKQFERYSEEIAIPCLYRAETLLKKRYDRALMRKLMEFTISNENSADETISMVIVNVFIMYPKELEGEWRNFPLIQKKILLDRIETGVLSMERPLSVAQHRNLNRHLYFLRESVTKPAR